MNLLSPIARSRWKVWKKRIVFWGLRGIARKRLAGLLELSFIHFARWVIIPAKAFPWLGEPQPKEDLKHDYLLFCSNFNGHWDQYLDAFSDVLSSGLNAMWEDCLNWPDARHVGRLKRYVRWHQVRRGNLPTDYFYCAYPDVPVRADRG